MKISVNTYSYHDYWKKNGILWAIEKTKELGFEGIEFCLQDWTEDLNPDVAKACREKCEELGLTVAAACIGADFINKYSDDEKAQLYKAIDFTAILGASNMRHDITSGIKGRKYSIGYDDALEIVVPRIRELADYAEQKGVGTMTENHGFFSQDVLRVEKLINTVAHPNFGALVDIGNFVCADEDPVRSVAILAPYAKHVHAKDFYLKSGCSIDPGEGWGKTRGCNYLRGAIIGHGDVNAYQSVQILKKAGYDGFISVEFEGHEDKLEGIRIGKANLERFIG